MIYIFAGDSYQVRAAVDWLGLPPTCWRRISSPEDLRGLDGPHVLLFGTYYGLGIWPDVRDSMRMSRARIMRLAEDFYC